MTDSTRREALLALIGAALAGASIVAGLLTMVWMAAFPYLVAATTVSLVIATVAALAMCGICLYHWRGWQRADRSTAYVMSWRLHWASYAVLAVAVLAYALVLASFDAATIGFVLIAFAGACLVLSQAVGAVQYVRAGGAPGTVGVHLRNWVERRNARADANS